MRLTCPDCNARYEVDAALIPPAGREVECANCGHRWHQPGEAPAPILLGDPEIAPEIERAAPVTPPRPSAAALDILRQEAARELSQRAAARARLAEETDPPEHIVAELVEDHEIPQALSLPDPQALAASLHWTPAPALPVPVAVPAPPRREPAGYNAGFGVALGLAAVVCGAYVAAPLLADQGRVGAALGEYRAEVDRARLWLYDRAAPLTDRAIAAVRGSGG